MASAKSLGSSVGPSDGPTPENLPTPKPALVWATVDHVLVQAFGPNGPTAAEWARFLEFDEKNRRQHGDRLRVVTFTDGGAPTKAQSDQLSDRAATTPVSVIFTSVALRFVVAVFTLRAKGIRTFAPDKMRDAFEHLQLSPADVKRVWSALPALSDQLGGCKTIASAIAARTRG